MKLKSGILSTIFSKLFTGEEMANEKLPSSADNVTDINVRSQALETKLDDNPNHDIVLLELY
ncbi:hypothetical protein [Rickettsia endosymbiont of Lasioglossum villosulum]|uniref:hypothetical protein n=1 Tax=Rickettsia endosymbiont of Lasioglossum villosulum TaxID=3066269 RepID=UPI0031334F09